MKTPRRSALYLLGSALALAPLSAAADPLTGIDAFAWLGSWGALRAPAVPLPDAEGESRGTLEDAFDVVWQRRGDRVTLELRRKRDDWCGRLGLRFHLAADVTAYTYAVAELPVRLPLARPAPGLVVSSWMVGAPRWMLAETATESTGVLIESTDQHGFFVYATGENTVDVHCAVDCSKVGDAVRFAFRLLPGAKAIDLQAAARQRFGVQPAPPPAAESARQFRGTGFVKVDPAGRAFVDGTGQAWYAQGCNLPHLMLLSEAEQESELAKAEAAKMTVVRFLIADWCFRPLYGVWNEAAIARLRDTIERCAAHRLRVLICLEYSALGSQYNASLHLSPAPGDLYLLERPLAEYREVVDRIVVPLRDDPAVFAWDVSNEPDLEPDARSLVQAERFRDWLRRRYGTDDALRSAWKDPASALAAAPLPVGEDYPKQQTQAARDFFRFGSEAVAASMVERARLVRAADAKHLVTIGHWHHRLLRGCVGAEIFDFWAYHTYDLWANGPIIPQHVLYLAAGLRQALPDRPRPVVIEEFGINPGPKYPPELCAAHITQFIEAGKRWGLAGLMHWWEMSPEMYAAYRSAAPYGLHDEATEPVLGVYLPPSQEWQAVFYPRYMTRRAWGQALQTATEAGWQLRWVGGSAETAGCRALLVLAEPREPEETSLLSGLTLPLHLLADGASVLPEARRVPGEAADQVRYWQALLTP